jgi:GT2 family glycosyltransferase
MKLAFVCVNFNNALVTNDYIKSILTIKNDYLVEILIVDNASCSKDLEILSSFVNSINSPNVTILRSPNNLGYFKGLNLALIHIDKSMYDYVVIGNNDLTFNIDFLFNLEKKEVDQNIFVIAPNIIRKFDGIHQNPHIINKFNLTQRIYRRIYFTNYYFGNLIYFIYSKFKFLLYKEDRSGNDKEQLIVMGYGACYILTKYFFEKFDKLDSPVFLMGEEAILANQVLSEKGATLYCPNLIVNHHDHTSIGKVPSKKLYEFSKISYQHYLLHLKHVQ